jgi:hypothetical protein
MCFRVQSIASAGEVFCASLAGQWAHRAGVAIAFREWSGGCSEEDRPLNE